MDILLPDVRVAKITPQLLDNTARFSSPLTGTVRTVARSGDRWSFQLDYQNLQGIDRSRIESFIAGMRGAANRALYSPGDYVQRGSFPSGELLTNNKFSSGTTGWSNNSSPATLSAIDRQLYVTVSGPGTSPQAFQSVSGVQFTPYVARSVLSPIKGQSLVTQIKDGAAFISSTIGNGSGQLLSISHVVENTTTGVALTITNLSGMMAGDYFTTGWASLSQCILVDNGPNTLKWSDDFTNVSWIKTHATTSLSGVVAPDGTLTADSLIEDSTASTNHFVQQSFAVSSSPQDVSFSVCANSSTRNWVALQLVENTGSTSAICYFNTATGAIGTSSATGNWSNVRVFVKPMGGGWFDLSIVSLKTNAATVITANIYLATGNLAASYTGNGTSGLQIWRATAAVSSVPTRLVPSVGAPVAATVQTGNAIYVKGLPVSTSGLLLVGDWTEINGELKRLTAALNSDGLGLGYMQFSPPLRNSPSDNDPVIVNMPMGRFILKNPSNGWSSTPPYFSNSSLVIEEAP